MPENIFVSMYISTPIITRYISISLILVTFLLYCNILQGNTLTFSKYYILNNTYRNIHRLLTSFLYFGNINLETVLHISFLCRYSKMIEDGFLNTSDYFYMLFIIWIIILSLASILNLHILGPIFSSTLTFIWTRRNPNAQVQMMGFIVFRAFYLPYIPAIIGYMTSNKIPLDDILGIFVGNSVYYIKYILPKAGIELFTTPQWIKKIFGEEEKKRLLILESEESD